MSTSDRPVQVAFWVPSRVQLRDLSGPVQLCHEARDDGAPFAITYFSPGAPTLR
jgi:hypothetical protein